MFKTTDKINKAMDLVIKASDELENPTRKEQAIECIHVLSKLQQDCFADMTRKEEPQNNM